MNFCASFDVFFVSDSTQLYSKRTIRPRHPTPTPPQPAILYLEIIFFYFYYLYIKAPKKTINLFTC